MAYRRKSKSKSKYNAVPTVVRFKGIRMKFDSQMEADQALILAQLELEGKIFDLDLQPRFELLPSFKVKTEKVLSGVSKQKNTVYTPDFRYTTAMGERVALEIKGVSDTAYRLRKKMFMYQMRDFDIDVFIEVGSDYRHEFRLIEEEGI